MHFSEAADPTHALKVQVLVIDQLREQGQKLGSHVGINPKLVEQVLEIMNGEAFKNSNTYDQGLTKKTIKKLAENASDYGLELDNPVGYLLGKQPVFIDATPDGDNFKLTALPEINKPGAGHS